MAARINAALETGVFIHAAFFGSLRVPEARQRMCGIPVRPSASGRIDFSRSRMSLRSGLPLLAALLPIVASAEQPDWQLVRPVVEKNCVECHGGKKTKGNVDLKALLADPKVAGNFELWEKVAEAG